jgi:hypothetical protein
MTLCWCWQAHVETNERLHNSDIDDSMSGTTSISVLFDGHKVRREPLEATRECNQRLDARDRPRERFAT